MGSDKKSSSYWGRETRETIGAAFSRMLKVGLRRAAFHKGVPSRSKEKAARGERRTGYSRARHWGM